MPVYATKKFVAFVLVVVVGVVLAGTTLWRSGFFSYFPRVYTQSVGCDSVAAIGTGTGPGIPPSVYLWACVRHTLEILDSDVIESTLTVTPKDENDEYVSKSLPNSQCVDIRIDFGKYTRLFPRLIDGNLSWSGKFSEDLRPSQTITLRATLQFDYDGEYRIHGKAIAYYVWGQDAFGTTYYLTVKSGKIVKVENRAGYVYSASPEHWRMDGSLSPSWGQINHTLRILSDNEVESTLNITAETEPPLPYVIVMVAYGYLPGLIPRNLEGSLYWSGDLHGNQTIDLSARLLLEDNGTYIISRVVRSYGLDYEMSYYVTVEEGKIVDVSR